MKKFNPGEVGHTLMEMRGVWHDRIELFNIDGSPLSDDTSAGSGTPGQSPFDNMVYIDFDGENFKLTNIHWVGRPVSSKTFGGKMKDGVMVFDSLGPGSFENIGMSGGPGILTFNAREIDRACQIYMEPDFIILTGNGQRIRHTVLYRGGIATRTLTAKGNRLSPSCNTRHPLDPRGPNGPVHGPQIVNDIWKALVDESL